MAVYRIYIDESGDHVFGQMDTVGGRYLGLTGCIIERDYYREAFHPEIEAFKRRHFRFDPDEAPLVLHRKELMQAQGAFVALRDPLARAVFDNDLIRILATLRYRLITIVIDKHNHQARHGEAAYHPYHYCLTALLERYCFFLQNENSVGDVMAESRKSTADLALKQTYTQVYTAGSNVRPVALFQKRLTSKEIKIQSKTANTAGLQLADLIATSSKKEVLRETGRIGEEEITQFDRRIWQSIRTKYHCNNYTGEIRRFGRYLL